MESYIAMAIVICVAWLFVMIVVCVIGSVIMVYLGLSTKAGAIKHSIKFLLFQVGLEIVGLLIFAKKFHII